MIRNGITVHGRGDPNCPTIQKSAHDSLHRQSVTVSARSLLFLLRHEEKLSPTFLLNEMPGMWSIVVFSLPLFVLVTGKREPNHLNWFTEQKFLKILLETSSEDNTSSLSLLLSDGTSNLTVNLGYYHEKFHGLTTKPTFVRGANERETFSFTFDQYANLKITREEDISSRCIKVSWEPTALSWPTMDCIPLQVKSLTAEKEEIFWYGGAEMFESTLASNTSYLGMKILEQPFYSSDIYAAHSKLGSVLEAFWINSAGWRVESDTAPLWISFKDETVAAPLPSLCFRSAWSMFTRSSYPYSQPFSSPRSTTSSIGLGLNYKICKNDNLYEAWRKASAQRVNEKRGNVHGKESSNKKTTSFSSPNMIMIEEPIWSTWAEFKKGVITYPLLQ